VRDSCPSASPYAVEKLQALANERGALFIDDWCRWWNELLYPQTEAWTPSETVSTPPRDPQMATPMHVPLSPPAEQSTPAYSVPQSAPPPVDYSSTGGSCANLDYSLTDGAPYQPTNSQGGDYARAPSTGEYQVADFPVDYSRNGSMHSNYTAGTEAAYNTVDYNNMPGYYPSNSAPAPTEENAAGSAYCAPPNYYPATLPPATTNSLSAPDARPVCGEFLLLVQFKYGRQGEFSFSRPVTIGSSVVVKGDRGEDLGVVVECGGMPEDKDRTHVSWALREATEDETDLWGGALAEEEKKARKQCQEIVTRLQIPMRICHAEWQFDKKKLTFHFTSHDPRPRFRAALDECYAVWKCRIWFSRYTHMGLDVENRRSQFFDRNRQQTGRDRPRQQTGSW